MRTLFTKILLVFCALAVFLLISFLLVVPPLHAQETLKTLRVGQSDIYVFDRMTTAAVGSPMIADIVPLSSRRLLVNAKSLGQTTLFVCDHTGTHRLRLSVVPVPFDLRPAAFAVQSAIGLPGVTAHAIGDTLFLEGSVSSAVAWQRAAAIAGVCVPKVKNLLSVAPDTTPTLSLAQTYAALLTPPLAPLGIAVQVVGEKTIALSGRYRRSAAPGASIEAEWPAPQSRRKAISRRKTGAGDDAPDPEVGLADEVAAGKDKAKASGKKTAAEATASDPLDHLIQSLPPDLKVINLLNLGAGPTRQILVRAKIIEVECTVVAGTPSGRPFPCHSGSPEGPLPPRYSDNTPGRNTT